MKKKVTIIMPEFKDFHTDIDSTVLMYPENTLTPNEQLKFIEEWCANNQDKINITIVSTSPYIIEAFVKVFRVDNDAENIELICSDGKSHNLELDDLFKYLSEPMVEMMMKF